VEMVSAECKPVTSETLLAFGQTMKAVHVSEIWKCRKPEIFVLSRQGGPSHHASLNMPLSKLRYSENRSKFASHLMW